MGKEEVNKKKEIANSNDTNKFEEAEIYQEVEQTKKEIRTDSYFDGSLIELIGWKLLSFLITIVTFGIAAPWGACMIYSYQINHTVYNGKRLKFEGTGGEFFVNIFKWVLLSIITLGIYIIFIPVKKTKWVISNIHFENEQFIKGDSLFDGKIIQLIGINILSKILNLISFGLLSAFTYCFKTKWIIKHTIINRKKIIFKGRAIALFGRCMLWGFLTVITFGIFGLWIPILMLKWQTKNTHIKVVGEEEQKDKSLYIAIPILIIGIILFGLIVSKIVTNMSEIEKFNFEEMLEDFSNSLDGFNSSKETGKGYVDTISNGSASEIEENIGQNTSNTSTVEPNENNNAGSLRNENTQIKISEFSGTYIDVFGSSETLTINNDGKVTISGRIITNSLADLKKQSDGTYSCSIPDGSITICQAGVSGLLGDNSKIRIEVSENGGALCFQKN